MSDPIMRGGSGISIGRDANRVPATFGVSTVDGETPVPIEVNSSTGQLIVSASGSIVIPVASRVNIHPITQLTLTASTAETTLIPAATTHNDLISIIAINTSAAATQLDFRDSTSGTIRLSLYLPPGDTRGVALSVPLPQATVNNNWTAQCGNSVSSVIITGSYVSNV